MLLISSYNPNPHPHGIDFKDGERMHDTIQALLTFLGEDQAEIVLQATAGVLKIGNMAFKDPKSNGESTVDDKGKSGAAVTAVSHLWGVQSDALQEACNCFPIAGQKRPCRHTQSTQSRSRDAVLY